MNINAILALPVNKGYSSRGAAMGRMDDLEGQPERLHLQQLHMQDGDYDTGGAYWGYTAGQPMWCAFSPDDTNNDVPIRVFVRATDREAAKKAILKKLPGTGWSFFR